MSSFVPIINLHISVIISRLYNDIEIINIDNLEELSIEDLNAAINPDFARLINTSQLDTDIIVAWYTHMKEIKIPKRKETGKYSEIDFFPRIKNKPICKIEKTKTILNSERRKFWHSDLICSLTSCMVYSILFSFDKYFSIWSLLKRSSNFPESVYFFIFYFTEDFS